MMEEEVGGETRVWDIPTPTLSRHSTHTPPAHTPLFLPDEPGTPSPLPSAQLHSLLALLSDRVHDLEAHLAGVQADNSSLRQENRRQAGRIKQLELSLAEKDAECKCLKSSLNQVKREKDVLVKEIRAREEQHNLSSQIYLQEHENLLQQIEDLKSSLTGTKTISESFDTEDDREECKDDKDGEAILVERLLAEKQEVSSKFEDLKRVFGRMSVKIRMLQVDINRLKDNLPCIAWNVTSSAAVLELKSLGLLKELEMSLNQL